MSEQLQVEIWSDVVCPWCYIGKRRFEAAVASSGVPVAVTWRSFQLDPTAPAQATEDVATYLGRTYGGGREAGIAMNAQVTQVAATVGLDYHLDDAQRASTRDAHRLLHLARALDDERSGGSDGESSGATDDATDGGRQGALAERLMDAYFVQARPIADHEVLAELATEAGLPGERVRAVLASDEFAADVESDQREAAALGANGVPFFVIDRRYGVSGAQPSELFERALRQAWAERGAA